MSIPPRLRNAKRRRRRILPAAAAIAAATVVVGTTLTTAPATALGQTNTPHSTVAVSGYDKNQVMTVNGKPFWYNGIQIRADKLQSQLGFVLSDSTNTNPNTVERIFKQAHDAGYTTVNTQVLWNDIQPDTKVSAVQSATIAQDGTTTQADGAADSADGDTATATAFGSAYAGSDPTSNQLGYLQFNLPASVNRADASKIRVYVNSGGNGTREFGSTTAGQTTAGMVFNHNLKVYPVATDAATTATDWQDGDFSYNGKQLIGADGAELPGATELPSWDSIQRAYFYDIDVSAAVKQAITDGRTSVRFVLASSTPDTGFNDANSGQPDATWADAATEKISIVAAGSKKDDSANSAAYLTHRNAAPSLTVSNSQAMNWSTYDTLLGFAAKYKLKLEVLWFGSNTTGATSDSRVPYYVLHNYQMTVRSDGLPLVHKSIGDPTGLYTFLADPADRDLLEKEGSVVKAISDHTATLPDAGTLVGYQLENEPHIGQLSPSSDTGGISGVPYSRSAVSLALRDKWIADGTIAGESGYPTYLLWNYINYLGSQVKASAEPVWTRVNHQQSTNASIVKLNEQKRASSGTSIDFVGMDSYQYDAGGLYNTGHGINRSVDVYEGENLPMVMENGGEGTTVPQQTFATIAGGSIHNVYDACSLDTHNLFDVSTATGTTCDASSTRVYKRTMTWADKLGEVTSTNKLLNKVGYDLATRNSDALAGSTLQFFNPTFDADANTTQVTKGPVTYAIQKYDKYGYSWQSAGFAIERATDEIALGTTDQTTFRLAGLAGKVRSVELGSYDDPSNDATDNTWVKDTDGLYAVDGQDVVVTVPKGDVARVLTTGDDIHPVVVPNETTFEAEASKISSSAPVTRATDDASGTWDKLAATKPGDWVSYKVTASLTGTYDLTTRFRKGPDRGVVQVAVDGKNVGEPRDLYDPQSGTWDPVTVPVQFSSDGVHTVTYTVTGKTPASSGYTIGVDYLKLTQTSSQLAGATD